MVLDGVDPCEVLRRNVGRVFAMHWKDCVGALPGGSLSADAPTRHDLMLKYFRVLGSGIVNWREWMGILLDANWKGWAVAEIDMAADPMGELAKFRAYFRDELSSIYGA
jgi:inosose dehydratase